MYILKIDRSKFYPDINREAFRKRLLSSRRDSADMSKIIDLALNKEELIDDQN